MAEKAGGKKTKQQFVAVAFAATEEFALAVGHGVWDPTTS